MPIEFCDDDRLSRFDADPGGFKLPPASRYPEQPVPPLMRWRVEITVELDGYQSRVELGVWGSSSTDAVERAKSSFLTDLDQETRELLKLRATAVLQEAV